MEDQKTALSKAPTSWYEAVRGRVRLAYIVIAIVFLALLFWAYSDQRAREQDAQMARLNVDIQKLADLQTGPFVASKGEMDFGGVVKMTTYAASLDGYHFQVDVPDGYHLAIKRGPTGLAYAEIEPEAEGEEATGPALQISLLDPSKGHTDPLLEDGAPGHLFVATLDGKAKFWISGANYDGTALPEFAVISASFKAL